MHSGQVGHVAPGLVSRILMCYFGVGSHTSPPSAPGSASGAVTEEEAEGGTIGQTGCLGFGDVLGQRVSTLPPYQKAAQGRLKTILTIFLVKKLLLLLKE